MQFDAAIWDAFDRAKTELASNPSIQSVELGWKISHGEVQPQLAVRVYVRRKLPLSEVAPELRLPPEVAGLPTDVNTTPDVTLAGHDMVGGDKITRIVWNTNQSRSGTLSYIATRKADNKRVMLSNEHVLANFLGGPIESRELFQPDISCRSLESKCNYVGYSIEGQQAEFEWSGKKYFIDCAIGEIKKGSSRRGIKELPGIAGSQDITGQPSGPGNSPHKVTKMGATTSGTEGIVISVNATAPQIVNDDDVYSIPPQPLVILIHVTKGNYPFEEIVHVDPTKKAEIIDEYTQKKVIGTVTELPGDRLHFKVPMQFAKKGDSGSAIVLGDRIVGLLYLIGNYNVPDIANKLHEIPLGLAYACHIEPVMARLGIRIDASTVTSAGEPIVDETEITVHDRELAGRLADLEAHLGSSERGRVVSALVREHGREIVDLVHHRKHVTVCWHRYRGPAFAALLVETLRQPERSIPTEHQGVSLTQLLSEMADMLIKHGSPALSADVSRHRDWLLEWQASATTIDELLAALEPEPILGVANG